jgi:hypothetical protein
MTAFFISSTNPEADLQRCDESRKFLSRLVITGATQQGEIKMFEGVVQSIEDYGDNSPPGRRWRVTLVIAYATWTRTKRGIGRPSTIYRWNDRFAAGSI